MKKLTKTMLVLFAATMIVAGCRTQPKYKIIHNVTNNYQNQVYDYAMRGGELSNTNGKWRVVSVCTTTNEFIMDKIPEEWLKTMPKEEQTKVRKVVE